MSANKKLPPLSPAQLTADVVIFTVDDGELKALLINRKEPPFSGELALPGGFIWKDETSSQAALRILKSKTNVDNVFFEQLFTFDAPDRDPRGHIITVAYFALVPSDILRSAALKENTTLLSVKNISKLAFDHKEILIYAIKRLRSKLAYSNIAYSLLPRLFTLTQLQDIYEVILGHTIDKRNFRKKIASLDIIEATNQKQTGGRHRPALLYKFKKRGFTELEEPVF
jgi:8-oxo-dGTP diphosphatase